MKKEKKQRRQGKNDPINKIEDNNDGLSTLEDEENDQSEQQ